MSLLIQAWEGEAIKAENKHNTHEIGQEAIAGATDLAQRGSAFNCLLLGNNVVQTETAVAGASRSGPKGAGTIRIR